MHAFATFKEAKVEGPVLDVLNKKGKSEYPSWSPIHYSTHSFCTQTELSNLSDRYNITKLINVFLSHQISQLSSAQDIVVNNVNPGLCVSELRRDMPVVIGYVFPQSRPSERHPTLTSPFLSDTSSTKPLDPPSKEPSISPGQQQPTPPSHLVPISLHRKSGIPPISVSQKKEWRWRGKFGRKW